jgi:hypothetical protein
MTNFKMFREKIFILWELHSKILVGDKNGQKERLCLIIDKCRRQKLCKRAQTISAATCMDDVQLYRVHVYRNHPHGLSECLEGY